MKICTTCGTEYPDEQKFCPKDGSALRSTADADLVDSIIADRYHISKKLGEGGMGAVYLGEHVKMGRKSAIKVMSQSMANDADAIARFNREAANAARINHPNVCAIYDFGETADGTIFLAMEFIEGEALSDVIKREGALPATRAADILRQTGDALQAAHDLGIVHRDLKPDNIMIAPGRGDADLVKVVDFGIAKAMGGEEGQNVTKTGLVVGTPEYMSPEQLSGDVLDGRSDIYSLALVFYRMLTGVLPFQADSAQETMIKRLTDDPLPLNQARPGVTYPDALQQVMNKALARMPGERYSAAHQFAADVIAAVAQMPEVPAAAAADGATQLMQPSKIATADASPTEALAGTRVSPRDGEAAAPEGATAPMEAVGAPTPTTPQPQARPGPRPAGEPSEKKKFPVIALAAAAVAVAGLGIGTVMFGGNGAENGAGPDSTVVAGGGGVTGDTAQPGRGDSPSSGPGDRPPRPPGGGTDRDTAAPGETRDSAIQPPQPPAIVVDPAGAEEWLFSRVLDIGVNSGNAAGIRDTALAYYNHTGTSQADRAFAANAVGQAYLQLGNRAEALRWGREAVRLDGTSRAYQSFVTQVVESGGP